MGIFGNAFTGWHLLIILAIVVLLFGAAKLPALAKGVGQSVRIFRGEMNTAKEDGAEQTTGSSAQKTAEVPSEVRGND
jgi:sec-independent protein translocase protein TatA